MLNFKSNLDTYGHNLLAYERDTRGANLHTGVNLHAGANVLPGANCAYEQGLINNVSWSLFLYISSTKYKK